MDRPEVVVATIVVVWSSHALEEMSLPGHIPLCLGRVESARIVNRNKSGSLVVSIGAGTDFIGL